MVKKNIKGIYAIADQAWLSLLNFIITLYLIKFFSKGDFGIYNLVMSCILLLQGVQNSLLISPFATVYPASSEADKHKVLSTNIIAQIFLIISLSILGTLGLYFYQKYFPSDYRIDYEILASITFAAIGVLIREAARSIQYAQGFPQRAFKGDLIYGGLLVLGLLVIYIFNLISLSCVLLTIGIAGVFQYIPKSKNILTLDFYKDIWGSLWKCGRWAIVTTLLTWCNLYSYPYFVSSTLGIEAVAEISVARLFMMPIAMANAAWSNYFRPKFAHYIASNSISNVRQIIFKSVFYGSILILIYGLLSVFIVNYFQDLFGKKYQNLTQLILLWLIFFSLTTYRTIFLALLLTAEKGYRFFHHVSWVGLLVTVVGFAVFKISSLSYVLAIICLVELIQLVAVFYKAKIYLK